MSQPSQLFEALSQPRWSCSRPGTPPGSSLPGLVQTFGEPTEVTQLLLPRLTSN